MSLLQAIKVKQNKNNAVNIGKIGDPNKPVKLSNIVDDYSHIVLVFNGITCNAIDFKNKLLTKVFNALVNVNSGKVWSENIGLAYDRLEIDTLIKYATNNKQARLNRNKTEFYQSTDDRKTSSNVSNKKDGLQVNWLENDQDLNNFDLSKMIGKIAGYCGNDKKYLYTILGKQTIDPDKYIRDNFPQYKTYPNLGKKTTHISRLTLNTELRDKLTVSNVAIDVLLTIGHKGLITISYGGYTFNVAMIVKHKKVGYQWLNLTHYDIASLLNGEIGIQTKFVGTVWRSCDMGKNIAVSKNKAKINIMLSELSKIYGNNFEILKKDNVISLKNKAGNVIDLAKCIDNGENNSVVIIPVYDGTLTHDTVNHILGQNKTFLGRYLKNNASLELDKSNDNFNRCLLRDFSYCYKAIYKDLQKNDSDLLTDYDRILSNAINKHGMSNVKNLTIKVKRELKQGYTESENITEFYKLM